jgi:hypothetical protein
MLKPNIKYRVTLTGEEREPLQKLARKGKTAGYRVRRAQILRALGEIPADKHRSDAGIGEAYGARRRAAGVLRNRFAEEGFEAALERKKRETPPVIKTDGEAEAKITAPACSQAPEGRRRRALHLSAGKAAEMGILGSISGNGIRNLLKKTALSHGCRNSGA